MCVFYLTGDVYAFRIIVRQYYVCCLYDNSRTGNTHRYTNIPTFKGSGIISSFKLRSRSALTITETELKLMARAAIIGESRIPKYGYNKPAAIGTPSTL